MGSRKFLICIESNSLIALEKFRSYEVIDDDTLYYDEVRIIDESGEDYIYPRKWFMDQGEEW